MTFFKYFLFICCAFALVCSCKKKNFKDADWKHSDDGEYYRFDSVIDYEDDLYNNKIVRISSKGELELFAQYSPQTTVDYVPLMSSTLANTNFNEDQIFVFSVPYDAQDKADITKSRLKINESDDEVEFKFKLKYNTGGSGVRDFHYFFFLIIPRDKADYELSGNVILNSTFDPITPDREKNEIEYKLP